jgi:predicted amidohydrolase YtcJ
MYRVWCLDDCESEADARNVRAFAGEEAAEKWAYVNDYESADYRIVGGGDATVMVRDVESGVLTAYRVTGESQAVYYARKIDVPEAGDE